MSSIPPFGTSTDSAQPDLAVIKAFGCTVVDFSVSADWSSQAGSLSFKIIEDDVAGDRLVIPVLGSPHLFELKDTSGNVLFQYVGLVDSFSRSSSRSKTYSVQLTSPLTILSGTQVILDDFLGLGGSIEGFSDFSGIGGVNFGHRNASIGTGNSPGTNQWWNVSNLINAFGILENDDPDYRVPIQFKPNGVPAFYGDYGFSGNSSDGMPLIKLMHALHVGINHLPVIDNNQKRQTHGGNLLYGRHNYNVNRDDQGVPYYYHFDAFGFYNQIKEKLGPQYRVAGTSKSLNDIVSELCREANLEYYCYIDLYSDTSIGDPTLQESDPNWRSPAVCSWPGLSTTKFNLGGRYGGTIRIQTVDKNAFINLNRPFSNIAYSLIGLESPDLQDIYLADGVHPGKRPVNDSSHGLNTSSTVYSDPLDSAGLDFTNEGFTGVGTKNVTGGGNFPVAGGYWDSSKLDDLKLISSDISIKLNDFTTMKVVTGGKQTRLVTVPKSHMKMYWGDIILPEPADPTTVDTATDPLGINQTALRKVPVVTQKLHPEDMDDFIFIDMKELFGDINITGVLHRGVYAASMYEIRIAMGGSKDVNAFDKWLKFMQTYKYAKLELIREYYYPDCVSETGDGDREDAANNVYNRAGGAAYGECINILGYFAHTSKGPQSHEPDKDANGENKNTPNEDKSENTGISCQIAENNIVRDILPKIHEKVKTIGDTHYGKSWYLPVPYFRTKEDLNGNNLVGNFERSWEITDSAYVEPANYYGREIPQSNQFVANGKVSPFVNYDFNFVFPTGDVADDDFTYDEIYAQKLNPLIAGKDNQVFNFSEYSLDQLCSTKYVREEKKWSQDCVDIFGEFDPFCLKDVSVTGEIIHAAPQSIENEYSFLPYAYDTHYDRSLVPFYIYESGDFTYFATNKSFVLGPTSAGQEDNEETTSDDPKRNLHLIPTAVRPSQLYEYTSEFTDDSGDTILRNPLYYPIHTATGFLENTVDGLHSLSYEDNGRFQFAYVKCTTARVIDPPVKDTGLIGISDLNGFLHPGAEIGTEPVQGPGSDKTQQKKITQSNFSEKLYPFPVAVSPRSISYAQISNRHVYGPWITSLSYIPFRGKIEYEQDESLVPENFLIPTNFGQFGDFTLSQTSGLEGLNLAAQGRANAIDDFALFAVEEGSIKVPGVPAIKRIGNTLYGLPQITDISISVSNSNIDTSYSFKTISPRFNKNNRDVEKNLSKISNKLKKIKFR